jgi:hypothetical protein
MCGSSSTNLASCSWSRHCRIDRRSSSCQVRKARLASTQPASQPGPGLKQGLVGQFGGVWPGELAGDGDQAGAGQPVDEPPFPVAELVVAGHPPGVRGTPSGIELLARPDHLDEDPFDVQALAFVDPLPEGALSASGQGAFDASDVPVGLGGDDPAFLPFPQPG